MSENSPELEQPDLKKSKRPEIQKRVESVYEGLIPKRPGSPSEHVYQESRDKVAAEIVRKRLRKERDDASLYDSKTNLLKDKPFQTAAEKEIEATNRNPKRTLRFMLLDIDKFGQFNNKYDELTGDNVLREVASAMKKGIRTTDTIGRWGGEEFVGMFPSDPDMKITTDLTHPAERVRRNIEVTPYKTEHNPDAQLPEKVTASVGTTNYITGESFEQLFKRASLANTIAKVLGRNRTVEAILTPEGLTEYHDYSTGKAYQPEFSDDNILSKLHNVDDPEVLDVVTGTNGKLQLAV